MVVGCFLSVEANDPKTHGDHYLSELVSFFSFSISISRFFFLVGISWRSCRHGGPETHSGPKRASSRESMATRLLAGT